MTPENRSRYNEMIRRINAMPPKELSDLLKAGECPFEPEHLLGVPLGMFHCEVCGAIVVAGVPHPPLDLPWNPEHNMAAKEFYTDHPELWP